MLVLIGALLVSFIFPFVIFIFLRGAHKDDAEYKKDCTKLLLKGLLLGFPVFGFFPNFITSAAMDPLEVIKKVPENCAQAGSDPSIY